MSEPTRTHPPDADHATRTHAPQANGNAEFTPITAPPGYEFLGEIDRGGMGIVFRALDLDLGREVAVKVLLPQYAPGSPTARRFLDEARITGRLQHPGIPPIYRVGAYPDGRPFLAMKLIGGDTLEKLLKERTDPDASAGDAGNHFERAALGMFDRLAAFLESGRFLAIFEHVAQAVAYAHQEGVIHRDLKPANIMVGDFGEVQVMDWGIARSSDRRPETADGKDGQSAATVAYLPPGDLRTPHSDLTQAGAILGTPAYMPPEQAIGAVDQVGKHSDVFGLGAILCVILTGKPPYVGADAESNRQLAARAKLDDAFSRLDASGAEPELIVLAKRCLAAEPKDRPANAGEVWEAVATFRADSERRARQAEMDRARAEVRGVEERKRRKVKYALAFSVLGLLAVTGFAAWWFEGVRAQRRADQIARETELTARQVRIEREVENALADVEDLRKEGWEQVDDPARWEQTLASARLVLARAAAELGEGPSDDLRARLSEAPSGVAALDRFADVTEETRGRVAAATAALEQDERDRKLIAELNRITDGNEIRYFFPMPLNTDRSNQFAAAFRNHGIDLLEVPTAEVVAWIKGHRLRGRLVMAIRNWHQSLPSIGLAAVIDTRLAEALYTSAAVAGALGPVAIANDESGALEKLLHNHGIYARLGTLLKAVTEDPFAKEWWDATERKDSKRLRELVADPRLRRLPAREMASLAEGFNPLAGSDEEVVDGFLAVALDRFPGEFWVHFRQAVSLQFRSGTTEGPSSVDAANLREPHERNWREESYRHLTAALAIRPNSSVARMAIGMELIEHRRDEAAGKRMLESAVEVDPLSPWPHLFVGMFALEKQDWPLALRSFKECIRLDPDTGYFMTSATALFFLSRQVPTKTGPTDRELREFFNDLIAIHPNHPGGYDLLANYLRRAGDHRAALETLRKARDLIKRDYPGRLITSAQVSELESQAAWEEKLPAVLSGKLKPADRDEVYDLAAYCATFEKRFALATRFIVRGIEDDPHLLDDWMKVAHFAGWAVQASTGRGADASTIPLAVRERYRRQALEWIRESIRRTKGGADAGMGYYLSTIRDFAPVRDSQELAKLPAAERAAWEKLWAEVVPVIKKRKFGGRPRQPDLAPPPRVK
jgi:serine/threonine protein kinase